MDLKARILKATLPDAPYSLLRVISSIQRRTQTRKLSVLDLGGGSGLIWKDLQKLLGDNLLLKVTLLDATVEKLISDHENWERLSGVLPGALSQFEESSYDIVTAFEVIEHLPIDQGYRLLYGMERVAKYAFGVSTPNGFMYQPPSPNNDFNAHVSGWDPQSLRQFGFTRIYGHGRVKIPLTNVNFGWVSRFFPKPPKFSEGISAWRVGTRAAFNQQNI